MLRKLTAIMAAAVLLITGCATKVKDPDSITEGYRMAKVNGVLYYDAARESEIDARCGVMDGEFTKAGEADEIPVDDNTCNFDGANGWQAGATEGEIEICIDGKWMVFCAIDDVLTDLSQFKYCKYMEGTLPDAEITDKMLVLTSEKDATYNDVMTFYMNADPDEESKYYPIYLSEE